MICEIKHKSNGSTIFAGDFDSIKSCVEAAVKSDVSLSNANLRCVDLRGVDFRYSNLSDADFFGADLFLANFLRANLRGVDLRGADLFNATGDGAEIITITSKKYTVNIIKPTASIQIGCERYAISQWLGFDDDVISAMDDGALEWWRVYKPIVIMHLKALDLLPNEE